MRSGLGFLAYVRRRMDERHASDTLATLAIGMLIGAAISFGSMLFTGAFR